MDNKILDNLSGQEIREMIIKGTVKLDELSTQALETLFDYESDRVSDGASDASLLLECAEILDNANHGEEAAQKSQAFLKNVLDEMCAEKSPKKKKRSRWKTVAIIAAVLLISVFGITALADTMGFNILSYLGIIADMKPGDTVDVDGITLEYLDKEKTYASVEELIYREKLEIMYPTVLPEGVSIQSVEIYNLDSGGKRIDFKTGNPNTVIIVDTKMTTQDDYSHLEKHTVGNHDFYLFEEDLYYAICYEAESYYSIGASSKENLILIIDNMKEYGT